ncbi:cupin domain-containing protein [Conexibacter sp. JD483]|uniref:cupin domain-containing protein n=1 Tax=unclassified Conexibacter TaxID=2627773 RepID=UPI00271842AE|nr:MULTISPECIES: cupin domain-containing protein [unclassified Conexibacter]MDO8187591.1 cupin domain-containing protein [Conexibacter sp. CPCC 205706]MDO8198957.1 cupin domain-containing protein [Conexibacter sp. CPCC 205762]MDR9370336.1 cupin domain-containing protein [Conexibacter sp. JD483]
MLTPARTEMAARRFENPVVGDIVTLLETSRETAGARTLLEVELAPGGGTPPHRHHTYEERFHVNDGTLVVEVDGIEHVLGPGESACAPAGSVHRFVNHSVARASFDCELRPGHEGFERALRVTYALAAEGRVDRLSRPRNPLQGAVLLRWSEMGLPGKQAVLDRPLRALAQLARLCGVERRLERRYLG